MEILDPRTKSCTFLTMHQMVREKGKRERAQCSLKKNEAFMTSENLWIAAESFKVSLSPNPDGLIYTEVPPTYYIKSEIDHPSTANQQTRNTLLDFVDVQSCDGISNRKSVQFRATPYKADGTLNALAAPSVDYRNVIRGISQQINDFQLTKGSKVHLVMNMGNDHQGNPLPDQDMDVILSQNPLDMMCAGGYGKNGLEAIECFTPGFNNEWPPYRPPNAGMANPQIPGLWYLRITKALHPGLLLEHVKVYFSKGQYAYCETTVDPSDHQSVTNTCQYMLDIWGPSMMVSDNNHLTEISLVCDPNGDVHVPAVKLYTKGDQPFRVGNKAFGWIADPNNPPDQIEVSCNITELGEEWVKEDSDYFHVSLWCDPQNMGPAGMTVGGGAIMPISPEVRTG